jgi:choice-of-anchor B domain-containing protein
VKTRRLSLSIAALAASVAAFAHLDDPKARDLLPPVNGPIFRAGEGSPAETFDSNGIVLKSWIPLNNFSGAPSSGNDCWGYISPSGREYAIMGLSNGTSFVEITDPANPVIVGHVTGPNSLWRCVKTYGQYCYAGSEAGNGIQVMSLANIDGTDPGQPRVSFVRDVTAGNNGTGATHTLWVDVESGFLYRAGGGSNGLRMYALAADPSNPSYVGLWSSVYVHEVQVFTYRSGPYAGRQIAFCCGGANTGNVNTGVYVVDVTNKAAPVQLSYTTYPGARYCHQSWLSNDLQRIYINDELDEGSTTSVTSTIVMNVANLNAPFVEGAFTNGNPAVGHNLYIGPGNRLFEANYRSGIRVFDLNASATNPPETAFFDTWPGDDLPQFNGLWNVWPWFPSGTFIGSDINRGLFIWRFGFPAATFSYPNGRPSVVAPTGASVTFTALPPPGGTIAPGSVKMRVTPQGGTPQVVTAQPLGGNSYRAAFPALACGIDIGYAMFVETPDGPYEDPAGVQAAVVATGVEVPVDDACEAVGGWLIGGLGDTAASGQWINADPIGTAAQPEDDRTPAGTRCFVTGNGPIGGNIGAADVDGGFTSLRTPLFDGRGTGVQVSYWRWYSNDQGAAPNADSMPVSISNDGGATWVLLEDVTQNANAWVQRTFRIADFVTPTAAMRLRFDARDLGAGSIVEAAIDDFRVLRYDCTPARPADLNGDGVVDGNDLGVLLADWGTVGGPADLNGDGIVDGNDLGQLLADWGA